MEWLVGLAILFGLIGILVPILPGLFLVAGAIGVWAWTEQAWWLLALVVVVTIAATIVKYLLPARATRDNASTAAVAAGAVAGIVGMFVVPVVGLFIGFVLGVLVAELVRTRDVGEAWGATRTAIKGIGIMIAVELASALFLTAAWVAALTL